MGRTRTFDPDAVAAAMARLVAERGYDAVGIDDLVRSTGVGRGSLYAAFGGKAAIGARALALADGPERDRLAAMLLASSAATDPDVVTALRAWRSAATRPELALGSALLARLR